MLRNWALFYGPAAQRILLHELRVENGMSVTWQHSPARLEKWRQKLPYLERLVQFASACLCVFSCASAPHRDQGPALAAGNSADIGAARAPAADATQPALTADHAGLAAKTPSSVFYGEISYYSDKLSGHRTANGERYNPRSFTAAHPSLPFGTLLRVRTDSGKITYVRVNDRGPYARGRVLDLSKAAASQLGILRRGVAKARIEVLEWGRSRRRR